ncbi:hypothetical protein A2U01_0102318, partial [Trifolium medium]|nr:hypothetical protein [Trifolium medium]
MGESPGHFSPRLAISRPARSADLCFLQSHQLWQK